MEDKKDIGSFFKDKLKEGKKSPDKNLWNRINTSLDELAERKESNLRYWLAGLGIPILLGFFLLFNPSKDSEKLSETPERNTELSFPSLEEKSKENDVKFLVTDSLENITNPDGKLNGITANMEEPTTKLTHNPSEKVSDNETKKSSTKKSPSIDETYKVSKNYYYYNSEAGKEWITTDKNKIDSLLSDGKKTMDSIVTKKNDSLVE